MEYIQEITLNLNTHAASLVVNAKQNDVDTRILHVQFAIDGEKYLINPHNTIGFRLRKPDSHFILDKGKPNNDGTVTIVLTKQCLTAAGRGYADVVEYGRDGTILSTACFILNIQASPGGNELDEAVKSSNEFNYLTDFIIRANEIIGDAEYWAEQAYINEQKIEGMNASVENLPVGNTPTVEKSIVDGRVNLHFGIPQANPVYCTFDIDLATGQLFVYCPDQDIYAKDLDFIVDETTGQLKVIFNE